VDIKSNYAIYPFIAYSIAVETRGIALLGKNFDLVLSIYIDLLQ